jgi:hypothetical protein
MSLGAFFQKIKQNSPKYAVDFSSFFYASSQILPCIFFGHEVLFGKAPIWENWALFLPNVLSHCQQATYTINIARSLTASNWDFIFPQAIPKWP